MSLQGLDFADEGFSLTFYQNIFTHPADVEYLFLYYLTGLIGGVWELLLGDILGTYGFRILFALTSGGIVLTTFAILKPYFKSSIITLSTLACVLWPGLCLYYFNHDCLTVLLFLLTIYAMMKGLDGNSTAWWIMGILLILNTSARIPNAALSILILIPLVDASYSGQYFKATHNMMRIIGGTIIGCIIMIIVMYLLQHIGVWASSIGSLFIMSNDSSDTHSIGSLIGSYSYTYKSIFTSTIYGLCIYLLYTIVTQHLKKNSIHIIVGVSCIVFIYALLTRNIYAMWGAVTSASIIYAISNNRDSRKLILALAAISMLVIIPLGGDSYANICNSCMWLGMPLLTELLRHPLKWEVTIKDKYMRTFQLSINNTTTRQIGILVGVAFLLYVSTHTVCYFDDGNRLEKTHRTSIATAATTFTSYERVRLTDDIVSATLKYRMPGNYLLVFDNAPMLHYLTDMQPYLGSPWGTFWGTEMFERQLFDAEHSLREHPLIAIPHFFYRDLSETDYLDAIEHPELHKKAEILFEFMRRNGYSIAYQDHYITLYHIKH